MNYIINAIIQGIIVMILGTFISVGLMYLTQGFTIKKITFWPSLLFSNFLSGFIGYLIFEYAGVNKWYCNNDSVYKHLLS
jgi:hypothetical protein